MSFARPGRVTRSRGLANHPPPQTKTVEESDSSSDDEDGIAAVATPQKSKFNPSLSTRHTTTKRRLIVEDGHLGRSSKKQRTIAAADETQRLLPGSSSGYPTPDSSHTAPPPIADGVSSNDTNSMRTSPEDEEYRTVESGIIDVVNNICGVTKRTGSSGRHSSEEAHVTRDDDSDISDVALDDGEVSEALQVVDEQELGDMDLSVEATSQELARHDGGAGARDKTSETVSSKHDLEEGNGHKIAHHANQKQELGVSMSRSVPINGVWDTQHSPAQAAPTVATNARRTSSLTAVLPTGTKASLEQLERRQLQPSLSKDANNVSSRDNINSGDGSQPESTEAAESEVASSDSGTVQDDDAKDGDFVPGDGEVNSNTAVDDAEEHAGDLREGTASSDNEDEDDHPVDAEAEFNQDMQHAISHNDQDNEDSAIFDPPTSNALTYVELPPKTLQSATKVMRRPGWTNMRDWKPNLMVKDQPQTPPGKYLVCYLTKLEDLVLKAPVAPLLEDQNTFLSMHIGALKSHFRALDLGIEHIRSKRLSFPPDGTVMDRDHKARKEMSEDLVSHVVPLIIRVLGEAWVLGEDGSETAFTASTVQILAKLIGWLEKLYNPLMRELEIRPLAKSPERDIKARKALKPLISTLRALVNEAPKALQKKEENQLRMEKTRQLRLRRQEEIRIRQMVEAKAKQQAELEQNRRVKLALRGHEDNPRVKQALRGHEDNLSTSRTVHTVLWRKEEELSLCTKLQGAYNYDPPRMPELRNLAFTLGYEEEEIKKKSRDLLKEMFIQALPSETGRNIQSMVHDLMRQWK